MSKSLLDLLAEIPKGSEDLPIVVVTYSGKESGGNRIFKTRIGRDSKGPVLELHLD